MLKWTKQHQHQLQTILDAQDHQFVKSIDSLHRINTRKRYSTGNFIESSTSTPTPHSRMPTTLTHTLERHLNHRRSLDNQLDERRMRTSLTGLENKENFGVHFVRSPFGNTNISALQDLSNGMSPKRLQAADSRRRQVLGGRQPQPQQPLTPNRLSRFSDDFAEPGDVTPLSRMRFRNLMREDSLSSSRMGDVTLDRMLDAIIESARKDVKVVKPVASASPPYPSKLYEEVDNTTLYGGDGCDEPSIHEMEVRTPTHLKRQRVVRRKNPRPSERSAPKVGQQQQPKPKSPQLIGLTLPNGIPSPETPVLQHKSLRSQFLGMDTPPRQSVDAYPLDCEFSDNSSEMQRCSTPTLSEAQSIKRCLSFSSDDADEEIDYSAAKRGSVASSCASSTGDYCYSGRSSRSSQNSSKLASLKGCLDVSIFAENQKLNVHVIRCRDLQRSNGSTSLNAYVKVALIRKPPPSARPHQQQQAQAQVRAGKASESNFQRTAVHRHSSRPYFDHHFKFDVADLPEVADDSDRLQLAVWHRDRQLKRSEFLGCMSFPLQSLLQQPINGSYRLQSQSCLNNPQPAVPVQQHGTAAAAAGAHPPPPPPPPPAAPQPQEQQQTTNCDEPTTSMATLTRQKSDDDVISIDSMAQPGPATAGDPDHPMVLSKKALHQRDADENLFLRFLELDPPPGEPAPASGTAGSATGAAALPSAATATPPAQRSSAVKPIGRTPFTMTKKLMRTTERGFGFSIVWTHPPRVEKIEPGLSADRCGILPGDYVIFVDKHNVVTMPEADVLNLIRSQGSALTLEIFRRPGSGLTGAVTAAPSVTASTSALGGQMPAASAAALSVTGRSNATTAVMNGKASSLNASDDLQSTTTTTAIMGAAPTTATTATPRIMPGPLPLRPSTACSGTSSIEAAKRRLNLPQVTFSKESIVPVTDNRRRILFQLISREQNFISALHFGLQRYVQPLLERKDLISPNDHRTLFQNIDELQRISEDILEQLCNDDQEPQMNFVSRVYLSKTTAICAAYKKYCNGIKRADCVLVNKSRQTGSEFVAFITEPPVPRKCPDLTMFIHRPLQHFREILKLMQLLASNCHVDTEEHKNFITVINELQAAYREITVSSGLMEPLGEGRPLLTLQDLESRMVFTKCKPFTLAVQGRQWIFGGDLSRVEGRSVKPYWTLLFSDIIVFAKVSRDRVLFITEEPVPIANIVDSCFHMRKKTTEFRLTVDPNGRMAESPTGYCAPDLSRTPKKGSRRKSLMLRAPSLELKAVWQNLLQRQIFLVNAALGSTPLSSPLDSPDVLNTIVPLSDIGIASASIGSIKLSSMDSINLKNQQQNHRLANTSDRLDMLIDEKCRILNKTGTPKSSALHLANWMKGQLDKQQEQARLAAIRTGDGMSNGDDQGFHDADTEPDERITYWTRQQLEKRTKELNLVKENGLRAKANFGGKRLSGVDELSMSDAYSEAVSQISQSHSTTSDSQITVRSSPIVLDKIPVCRHCHKNCQQSQQGGGGGVGGPPAKPPRASAVAKTGDPAASAATAASGVLCNSLKVQHSQASPNRCCANKLNGSVSRTGSVSSMSSSTITGDQPSDRSSKVVASSSGKRETGDTESDVAQLITDDLSQSEATTDDSVGCIPTTSSSSGRDEAQRKLTDSLSKLRILEERVGHGGRAGIAAAREVFMNGNGCDVPADERRTTSSRTKENGVGEARPKPQPPPRRVRVTLQTASETTKPSGEVNQKASVTSATTETAKIVRSAAVHAATTTASAAKKSPLKSPKTPTNQFVACNCECKPADFEHATLSPDELQQQTCKIIESPKQSPKMPRNHKAPNAPEDQKEVKASEDPHKNCKCVCDRKPRGKVPEPGDDDDDNLSLMLIGLAQFSPAAKFFNMKVNATSGAPPTTTTPSEPEPRIGGEAGLVPSIAVVPPTPEAILTKTTTNVWDNSASGYAAMAATAATTTATTTMTTTISAKLQINNVTPRQAVIENIPDDSCDESPLDEEPPYRPMNNALRRYGTMSSLEKLPSDERNDEADLDDELMERDPDTNAGGDEVVVLDEDDDDEDDEDEDENDDDNARADNIDMGSIKKITTTKRLAEGDAESAEDAEAGSSAMNGSWSAAGRSAKMSFFEESRAFIDKYLGRWNQDTVPMQPLATSDLEEQMDECTSGATSGEEVWGTPTSGGDNDDMHLINSENTHSSPTKSSNSLNDDDDDTELMMDELLMAPPMTASTIRGLLPRRRLEPLFEEETESDEEKTQQESEELKKGETTTNGHYLEDLVGSSSETEEDDQEEEAEEDDLRYLEELDLEDEPTSLTADDRQSPRHLPLTGSMRPLRAQPPPSPGVLIPVAVLKASSCEYLLEQRSAVALETITSCSSSLPETTTTFSDCTASGRTTAAQAAAAAGISPILVEMKTTTTTMRSTTMTMMTTLRSPARSSTTTTTSNASGTTSSANYSGSTATSGPAPCPSGQRTAAKFIPPPPPPRRLLLTQTNLKTSASSNPKPSRPAGKSGASADDGSSGGAAAGAAATTPRPPPPSPQAAPKASMAAYNIGACGGEAAADAKRPSSTIIETSLLGSAGRAPTSPSSTTASRTTAAAPSCSTPRTATASRGGGAADSDAAPAGPGFGLSPRLEMRLALNHDILGDEDLICYDPGPDLTTILGHDLSTFHRRTGRDLLNRSANRVQPREAVISFSQQRNSKIDTPTVNRRPRPAASQPSPAAAAPSSQSSPQSCRLALGGSPRVAGAPPPLHPNRNTWSSSASVDRSDGETARGAAISKGYSFSSDESKLGDLEILARREKIYCMSQSRSGLPARTTTTTATASSASTRPKDSWSPPLMRATSTTSMGDRSDTSGSTKRTRKIGRDETALMETGKSNRLIDFIKRRNSEIPSPTLTNCSQSSLSDSNPSSTPLHKQLQMSPRKDNDKPSLNRRLWKQIKKRRRSNSVSEVVAS